MKPVLLICAALAAVTAATAVRAGCEPEPLQRVGPSFFPDELSSPGPQDVAISYHIDLEGRAVDVRVVAASADPLFIQASLEAVRKWRYVIGMCGVDPAQERLAHLSYEPDPENGDMVGFIYPGPGGQLGLLPRSPPVGTVQGYLYGWRDGLPYLLFPPYR